MSKLNSRTTYLQIALNSDLNDAQKIIAYLPPSDRIIIEVGTPLIKQEGISAIRRISYFWQEKLASYGNTPYIVADLKTIDRGITEAQIAATAGANAAIAMGNAPLETLNSFINECYTLGIDPMVDMMNVEYSLTILRRLKNYLP